MFKFRKGIIIIACTSLLLFAFAVHIQAKPPQPGPNFVWVKPHTAPDGTSVPGHWKYNGPATPGKTWVPGHYRADGTWEPGHWKKLAPSKPGKTWVPGHYGPKGRWIRGHWK